jgi:hypothetical protein
VKKSATRISREAANANPKGFGAKKESLGLCLFGQSTAQGLLLLQKSNGIIREALFCMNMLNKNNFVVN